MKINVRYTFSLFQEGFFYALFSHKAINYFDALDLSPHPEC